jgi:hypothetical protein
MKPAALISKYKNKKEKRKQKIEKVKHGRSERRASLLTYPNLKIIMGLFYRCLKKYAKILLPKRFNLQGVVGTGDPYYTGLLLGAYEAVAGCFRFRQRVRLTGDFYNRVCNIDLNVSGHISIAAALWPMLWLYLHKPVRVIIKQYRKQED